MKKLFLLVCCASLFVAPAFARPITPSTRIALLDLTLRTEDSFETLTAFAPAVGITLVYLHPSKNLPRDLCGCDGVFIVFDEYFLSAPDSEYTQLVIEPLKNLVTQHTKIVGLLLPEQLLTSCNPAPIVEFLGKIGLDVSPSATDIKLFLTHKSTAIPLYTTAQQSAAHQVIKAPVFVRVRALPTTKAPAFLRNNFPLTIEISCAHNNRVLITTSSALTFADLQENSFINPLDPQKRTVLLRETLRMLAQVQKEPVPAVDYGVINKLVNNKVHKTMCTMFKKQQGIYKWTSNGVSCGWMSVDYEKKFIPTNLSYVAKTDFDVLWLELPIGLYHEPEKFNEKISYFATELVKAYHNAHRALPKIIIDFNLGAILQWHHYASEPVDLYGHHYKDIPAPLDTEKFWRPAIIDVFSTVIENWRTVTHEQLPIDGVLFNLYFWNTKTHRLAMPFYSNLIDFSDSAWHYFAQKNSIATPINTEQERIKYLLQNDQLENYIAALEQGAFEVGKQILNDLHSIAPCAMVGIYTNAPLDTWFYRGFVRALGSPERPLLWFTENLNFYGHRAWLEKNNIHALHMSNILLHHFNNKQDVASINRMARSHDGLWYSRVSRIGERYQPNKWWSAEATTMLPEQLIKLIGRQARKP